MLLLLLLESVDPSAGEVSDSDAVLESSVDSARVEEGTCTKLFELTESLEDWSVDCFANERRECDVFIDTIKENGCFVGFFLLSVSPNPN